MGINILNILYVAAGSALGGVARYVLSRAIPSADFPWGTLVVNLCGCLVIGFIYGLISRGFTLSEGMRLMLTVGFCGGFTTFSTFVHENYQLFEHPSPMLAAGYAGLSFVGGLLLVYSGYYLAKWMW